MKIGFVILCRYNSSRLPGKILKTIEGKVILQHIVDNLSQIIDNRNIVVATSEEPTDEPIVAYCNTNGIEVFRGDLNNVSKRFLDCSEQYGFDYATRINGDNLFIDLRTIKEMMQFVLTAQYDFVSNVKNRTFPKGMSVEVVRTDYYRKCYQQFSTPEHFEHVTIFLYENDQNKNYYYFYNVRCPEASNLQFAIDTQTDFDLAKAIVSDLKKVMNFEIEEVYKSYQKIIK